MRQHGGTVTGPLFQKSILVTGATSGIGYQTALDLIREGAFVIGVGRDRLRCKLASNRIRQACPTARVEYLVADLASQKQVRSLAEQAVVLLSEHGYDHLDVLVNNAGLYSSARRMTEDGVELTFAVNHLAPFLLTHLLIPALSRSVDGRVLTVSSNSHYHARVDPAHVHDPRIYIGLWTYGVSKLCNVLFSAEFNRRSDHASLHTWVVDPGLVNTDIALKDGGVLSSLVWRVRQKQGTSPEAPSRTILHLASAPLDQIFGDLYWKNSQPQPPSRTALNPDLAYRLWQESCRLTGIHEYFG